MSLLRLGAFAMALGVTSIFTPARPLVAAEPRIDRWQPFIAEAAARFDIPEAWIRAVMHAESGGRTFLDARPITSRAGAMGLMQLMPETYDEMRRRHGLGADPYEPRDNILAGTAYLRAMYDRFGFPDLFAAYNAGPGRYAEHLREGRPLPRETRSFLAELDPSRLATPISRARASGRRLFFPLRTAAKGSSQTMNATISGGLFVPLRSVPDSVR